jgi:hypothetical protein
METGMAYVTIFMDVIVVLGVVVLVVVVSFSCVTNEGHANDQTGMEMGGKSGMGDDDDDDDDDDDSEKQDGNGDLRAPTRMTTEDRHHTRSSLQIVSPIHPVVVVTVVQFLHVSSPTMIYKLFRGSSATLVETPSQSTRCVCWQYRNHTGR